MAAGVHWAPALQCAWTQTTVTYLRVCCRVPASDCGDGSAEGPSFRVHLAEALRIIVDCVGTVGIHGGVSRDIPTIGGSSSVLRRSAPSCC